MKTRIPQIKSTAKNLIVIALVTVCCGIVSASIHGEIHKFADLTKALTAWDPGKAGYGEGRWKKARAATVPKAQHRPRRQRWKLRAR